MAKQVLFITKKKELYKRVEKLMIPYQERFRLIAQIDNSIVAKSIIQEIEPQIVLIFNKTHFWDADHLIQDNRLAYIPIQFIVIASTTEEIEEMIERYGSVSSGLLADDFSDREFLDAMAAAERDWDNRYGNKMNVHESMSQNFRPSRGDPLGKNGHMKKEKFADIKDILTVSKNEKIWVFNIVFTDVENQSIHNIYTNLSILYSRIKNLFDNYGNATINFIEDPALNVILVGNTSSAHIDWYLIAAKINMIMEHLELPKTVLNVCDAPVELEEIDDAFMELENLSEYRFFVGDLPVLQKKWVEQNQKQVSKNDLEILINLLRQSMYQLDREKAQTAVEKIISLLYSSFSIEFTSFVWSELLMIYTMLAKMYKIEEIEMSTSIYRASFQNLGDFKNTIMTMFESLVTSIKEQHKSKNKMIAIVEEYIQKNASSPLTLEEVADVVHLSPSYFSKLFKKETGNTFVEALTARRIKLAKKLLQTDLSIIDVGPKVGFQNSKYFSQVFKKETGLTPSEYKRSKDKNEKTYV